MRSTDFTIIATAPTQLYTLSLHDALPICVAIARHLRDLRYAVDRDALSADRSGIRVCARIAAAVGDARDRVDVGRQRVRRIACNGEAALRKRVRAVRQLPLRKYVQYETGDHLS